MMTCRTVLFSVAAIVGLCMAPAAHAAVDTVTTTTDSGPGSLRDTIAAAGSGDTIVFSSGLRGQTIQLTSGEVFIEQSVTIDASALPGGIVIDGGGNDRVLEIGTVNVTVDALTVTNGFVNGDFGAGVLLDDASSSLIASNCVFSGNSADEGGGIFTYGTLVLYNCTVSGNFAYVLGGGIFGYSDAVTLNGCTLSGNSASYGGGGGVEIESGTLTLNNCVVSTNVAADFGGGIDAEDDGTLALTNCLFLGNSSGTAGAISVGIPGTVSGCTFSNNISTNGAGGGIVNYATLALNNCTFSGNSVNNNNGKGGGLVNSGILTMNNCTLVGNSVPNGSGGGICNLDSIALNNCTLSGNSATNNGSGGGFASFYATNVLINCTICSNSATFAGGLFDSGSTIFALTNTIVAGNTAPDNPDVEASFYGASNFIGGNPQLAALGDYGGPTLTIPPEFGSPVIDAGTDWVTNILATDQRGFPRLAGVHVDIGAVEARTAPANDRPVLENTVYTLRNSFYLGQPTTFQFSFTNVANADFTVLGSTNLALPLAQWTVLGNASQPLSPGQFEFDDAVSTMTISGNITPPQKFYRVVSP